MILVTPTDVQTRLGRTLTPTETSRVAGLADETAILIDSYLGRAVTDDDADADRVRVVASRMVARALSVPENQAGAAQWSETLGAYSSSVRYDTGSRDGGPWFTESDRLMLAGITGGRSSAVSVELVSERFA